MLQNLLTRIIPPTSDASTFTRFAYLYFVGGMLLLLVLWLVADTSVARFVSANWLAVGIAVALMAYGLPRKATDPRAGFLFLLGVGWLLLLLIGGVVLFWQQGIGVMELQWLLQ